MNKLSLSLAGNHTTNLTVILGAFVAWLNGHDHSLNSAVPFLAMGVQYAVAILAQRAQSSKLVTGLQAATIGEMCAERGLTAKEICARRFGEVRDFNSLTTAEGSQLIEHLKTITKPKAASLVGVATEGDGRSCV